MSALRTALALLAAAACAAADDAAAPVPGVAIAFDANGLSSLAWRGREYLTAAAFGTTWNDHVVVRAPDGTLADAPLAAKTTVDAARGRVRRDYAWGWLRCDYAAEGDRLAIDVTLVNTGVTPIACAHLQLLELALPSKAAEYDGATPLLRWGDGAPSVIALTCAESRIVLCDDDGARRLQIGFPYATDKPANRRYPLFADTGRRDWLPKGQPWIDRAVHPGCADHYRLSLRFGAADAPIERLAADAYARFVAAHPPTLRWADRRPIASLHLSSTVPHHPKNPRGWMGNAEDIDTTTDAGRAALADRLRAHVDHTVEECRRVGAQGVIIWDLEGQEYPHAMSYIGDPRQLPPEMEPLADELFQRLKDGGLKVGVTIRPQLPTVDVYDGKPVQVEIAEQDVGELLDAKIAYAEKRWGCTIFYIDSNVVRGESGGDYRVIDPEIFRRLALKHPDALLIPEHEATSSWAATAPYNELRQGWTSTPEEPRRLYPKAFSIIYVCDCDLAPRRGELIAAVKRGDVLLFRGWWHDPVNDDVISIMREAGK